MSDNRSTHLQKYMPLYTSKYTSRLKKTGIFLPLNLHGSGINMAGQPLLFLEIQTIYDPKYLTPTPAHSTAVTSISSLDYENQAPVGYNQDMQIQSRA